MIVRILHAKTIISLWDMFNGKLWNNLGHFRLFLYVYLNHSVRAYVVISLHQNKTTLATSHTRRHHRASTTTATSRCASSIKAARPRSATISGAMLRKVFWGASHVSVMIRSLWTTETWAKKNTHTLTGVPTHGHHEWHTVSQLMYVILQNHNMACVDLQFVFEKKI